MNLDITQAVANPQSFAQKMSQWTNYQNNYGVKVVGEDENISQHETSLNDLDAVIMTQYQLVAAASNVPATKLLGTTPKGFNATGEFEMKSYNEELRSIQQQITPLLDRHHLLLIRSEIAPRNNIKPFSTEIVWNPLSDPSAKELAETNYIKSQTDANLANAGAIDGVDIRQRIIADKNSGYTGIAEIVEGLNDEPQAEEQSETAEATDESDFNPEDGLFDGAYLITKQRYLDDAKVKEKQAAKDYEVEVTPIFEMNGKKYRNVLDGHHSLAAALRDKVPPVFKEVTPNDVFNAVTRV